MRFIASHVHGSGSSFRRGAHAVGHSTNFRLKEGSGVRCKYGAGRSRSSGSRGGSEVGAPVENPLAQLAFKIRINAPKAPVSILEECYNGAWIWYVDDHAWTRKIDESATFIS